ncbi:MAG: molybdopterin cofactor-binding domain-containing protein [Flavobacteriaceae bacterium]|nr:molybdopterin cofactor-binding domain-containing protein [Flavobacteriaceae bacterium]
MKTSRREFIKDIGYISVGFSLMGASLACCEEVRGVNEEPKTFNPEIDDSKIDAWLRIFPDGQIKVLTGRMELGQGVRIAMAQVAAEELNTDIQFVDVHLAETGVTPDEGVTAGSRSMERGAMSVRLAAASAREHLLEMASKRFDVDKKTLNIENGRILNGDKAIGFNELIGETQIKLPIDNSAEIYGKSKRKFVGKPIPRRDIADMVQGKHVFVQDLRFPDMVHARLIRPESYASTLTSLDESVLKSMPGFIKLVKLGSFLGVIAEDEFQAIEIMQKIQELANWENPVQLQGKHNLIDYIKSVETSDSTEENSGDVESVLRQSAITHESEYFKPYIMHASNGPSCAVAHFSDGIMEVWSHTQGVYPLRDTLAHLLGMPKDNIRVKGVPGSGCYGHNGADDVAAEAALLAKEFPNRHIRLQWTREQEHGWEPFGSAMLMKLQAGLNDQGKIVAWDYDFWSDGHSTRPRGDAENLISARFLNKGFGEPGVGYRGGAVRNSTPYYNIPNLRTTSHIFKGPLRVSALRGLGAYANIYAIECFMDELAEKAQKNPIDFRIKHSTDPRSQDCLGRLKVLASSTAIGNDEGIGYGFSRYKNQASYCAVAAHVRVDRSSGTIYPVKMWAVIDAGECINLDGLKNQTEGGMIQSASWALLEEVKFDEIHVSNFDWENYPILRFPQTPQTEVVVIDRPELPPLGAGEAAQGPATAAIINAIYDAVGVRIYNLPVGNQLSKRV